ncbi:hypothetical protein FEM21_11200 [Flavobacterium seoulense]|uniref:Uncharacterized protein n=1 Tax=Flavobacterium seoulense TaxID=1492738 RepID=A0A066WXQ2_9FLAO|nr:hypothetical protein FEM21_11200 [Flavobacterium seoulense]
MVISLKNALSSIWYFKKLTFILKKTANSYYFISVSFTKVLEFYLKNYYINNINTF